MLTGLDEAPSDEERQQSLDNCIEPLKRIPVGYVLRTAYDPGCVKTIQTPNPGERFSQIARNPPHSEIVSALIAIRRDSCSINFPRSRLFTQPRPTRDIAA